MNQRDMLITCRDQFAMYGQSHRAKIGPWQTELEALRNRDIDSPFSEEELQAKIADTTRKAEENERLCRKVQAVLDQQDVGVLERTAQFGHIAYADGISPKNQQTQIGVHFEEVAEMVESVKGRTADTQHLLNNAEDALKDLADHLKQSEPGQIDIPDRKAFLDACCDQLVTASLSAVLQGMDVIGGLREVNESNYSKLTDGVMVKAPITAKWVKGPNYRLPDLTPFI